VKWQHFSQLNVDRKQQEKSPEYKSQKHSPTPKGAKILIENKPEIVLQSVVFSNMVIWFQLCFMLDYSNEINQNRCFSMLVFFTSGVLPP